MPSARPPAERLNGTAATPVRLLRRGLLLEYATLSWNVVGVVVLAVAAIGAGSVALAGFGVDSLIEIVASAVVVWQLLLLAASTVTARPAGGGPTRSPPS
jgi:hypothetical protein